MKRESLSADEAILTRRSVRAFLPTPVDRTTVEELLALASRAPSGTNIQPWKGDSSQCAAQAMNTVPFKRSSAARWFCLRGSKVMAPPTLPSPVPG